MDNLSTITSGLIPGGNSFATSIISSGSSTALPQIPAVSESVTVVATPTDDTLSTIPSDTSGFFLTSTPTAELPINDYGTVTNSFYNGQVSYTGSNLRAVIEIGDATVDSSVKFGKELVELTTLSISVHRAKTAVNSVGFIGAKGYARGRRTVAGTMVLTQFTADILMKFLQSALMSDLSKDTTYLKVDQLPLFNLTLFFSNEYGYMSYQRLLGINLITSGTIYSMQDQYTEQTISYVASDLTPLLPISTSSLYTGTSQQTAAERTPGAVISSGVRT